MSPRMQCAKCPWKTRDPYARESRWRGVLQALVLRAHRPFERLLEASRDLLRSRYQDGEVDAVAMHRFASVVEEVDPTPASHEGHRVIVEKKTDDTFLPRHGCLDCNVWIDPVRLRRDG